MHNLTDLTAATTNREKQRVKSQNMFVYCQLMLDIYENQPCILAILRASSKNAEKWFKIGQETQTITRAEKLAEVTINKIVIRILYEDQKKMQE